MLKASQAIQGVYKRAHWNRCASASPRAPKLLKRWCTSGTNKEHIPRLIITDQPGYAADIARTLRLPFLEENVKQGYFGDVKSNKDIVAWCFPGSFQVVDPTPEPKSWKLNQLPYFPDLPDGVSPTSPEVSESIKQLVEMMRVADSVVCVMDATSEGQLLFQDLLNHARHKLNVSVPEAKLYRIWLHSKSRESLKHALKDPPPNEIFKNVAKSAQIRRFIDWSVQGNYSKLYSLLWSRHSSQIFQLDRIQLLVLKEVTERYLERKEFKPKPFYQVHMDCLLQGHAVSFLWTTDTSNLVPYEALPDIEEETSPESTTTSEKTKFTKTPASQRFNSTDSKEKAEEVANAIESTSTVVASRLEDVKQPPPLLYNLTSLQREAYERYSIPSSTTHQALLDLHQRHALITNPNTWTHQLPLYKKTEVIDLIKHFAYLKRYSAQTKDMTFARIEEEDVRIFDGAMGPFEAHAILPCMPTSSSRVLGKLSSLTPTMGLLYDMIIRRFLAAMMPDLVHSVIKVTMENADKYYFEASAAVVKSEGWRTVGTLLKAKSPFNPGPANFPTGYIPAKMGDDEETELVEQKHLYKDLITLRLGDEIRGVIPATVITKEPSPPPLYTHSRAMALMEDRCTLVTTTPDITPGETSFEPHLRYTHGLGTPQSRADVLTKLVHAKWLRFRHDRYLEPTRKAILLIKLIQDDSILDDSYSRSWESSLSYIDRGKGSSATKLISRFKSVVEPDITKHVHSPNPTRLPDVAYDLIYYHTALTTQGKALQSPPAAIAPCRCPKCGTKGMMKQGPSAYFCASPHCNFTLYQIISGHLLTESQVKTLITKQQTEKIEDFKDSKGNTFSAFLVLDPPYFNVKYIDKVITRQATKEDEAAIASRQNYSASEGGIPANQLSVRHLRGGSPTKKKKTPIKKESVKTGRPPLPLEVVEARIKENVDRSIARQARAEAKRVEEERKALLRENPTPLEPVRFTAKGKPIYRRGRPRLGEIAVKSTDPLSPGRPQLSAEEKALRKLLPKRPKGRPTKLEKMRDAMKSIKTRVASSSPL